MQTHQPRGPPHLPPRWGSHTPGDYPPVLITPGPGISRLGTVPLPTAHCRYPKPPTLLRISSHGSLHRGSRPHLPLPLLLTNPGAARVALCGPPPVSRTCECDKLLPSPQSCPCLCVFPYLTETSPESPHLPASPSSAPSGLPARVLPPAGRSPFPAVSGSCFGGGVGGRLG